MCTIDSYIQKDGYMSQTSLRYACISVCCPNCHDKKYDVRPYLLSISNYGVEVNADAPKKALNEEKTTAKIDRELNAATTLTASVDIMRGRRKWNRNILDNSSIAAYEVRRRQRLRRRLFGCH